MSPMFRGNRFLNVLLYLMIFIIPISYIWYLLDVSIASNAIQLIIYLTIFLGLRELISGRLKKIHNFSLFLLFYFIYAFSSDYLFFKLYEGDFFTVFKQQSQVLALFFFINIIKNNIIDKRVLEIGYKVFLYTLFLAPIVSIIQVLNPDFLTIDKFKDFNVRFTNLYKVRRLSFFGIESNYAISHTFLSIAALSVSKLYLEKKNGMMIILIPCIAITTFLTNTRFIMVGFIMIILMLIYYSGVSLFSWIRFIIIFCTVGVIVYYAFSTIGYNWDDFFIDRIYVGSILFSPRYASYLAFLEVFPQNIFFGTGDPFSKEIANSLSFGRRFIHIGWLSNIITYGLIGGSLLVLFYFYLVRYLLKCARLTKDYSAFVAFIIFILFNFVFVQVVSFSSGLMLVFAFNKYKIQRGYIS